MAYSDQYTLGETLTFQNVVQVAILTSALSIQGEAKVVSDTVYQKRQALCQQVIASPPQMAQKFARLLTTSSAILITTPDATIQTAVTNNWNKAAGVNVND